MVNAFVTQHTGINGYTPCPSRRQRLRRRSRKGHSAHMNRQTLPAPGMRLPIGTQTFATLREEGCYHMDRTPHIAQLMDRDYAAKYRPRARTCLVATGFNKTTPHHASFEAASEAAA